MCTETFYSFFNHSPLCLKGLVLPIILWIEGEEYYLYFCFNYTHCCSVVWLSLQLHCCQYGSFSSLHPLGYITLWSFHHRYHSYAAVNSQDRSRSRWQHQVLTHICKPGQLCTDACFGKSFLVSFWKVLLFIKLKMLWRNKNIFLFIDWERHSTEGGAGGGEEESPW